MTTQIATTTSRPRPLGASRTLADRFLAAVPLASVFLWLSVIYAWEAWSHGTPWLFGDELELTQISRSIAATGHAARRGEPYSFHSLYTYLTAPAWWLSSVQAGYSAVKYINVVAMSLTAFPAYFLARTIASPRASLFAAAASTAIPAFMYTSLIVDEPVGYVWSTLCLALIAQALLSRRRGWIVAAVVASLVAPLWRGELVIVPAVFALAAALLWWSGDQARRWRSRWTTGDWVGGIVLLLGLVFLLSAIAQWRSFEYLQVTRLYKTRVLRHALWGGGAVTIGIGVLPLVVGIGTLLRAPGERPSRALRVFRALLLSAIVLFGFYTGIKGAYNQNNFATRVWERNFIYVSPLFFGAVALWLDRRRLNLLATAGGVALAGYLVASTPYGMDTRLSSDAPGLAILSQANRTFALTPRGAEIGLFVVLAVSTAVLLLPRLGRLPLRAGAALAVAVAVFVFGWSLTAELSASAASNAASSAARSTIRGNPSWVDHYTGGAPTIYLAQQEQIEPDQNPEWLLEFWNRAIRQVWVINGCDCGPGHAVTPDVVDVNGTLKPQPGWHYVVAEPGIHVAGTLVARHSHKGGGGFQLWRLYRVDQPLRLVSSITGLYDDGWSEPGPPTTPQAPAYTRFQKGRGTLRVTVSRRLWGGPAATYHATIRMGTLAIGRDHQPRIGRVTAVRRLTLHQNYVQKTVSIRTPGERFRVEVSVDPTFVPHQVLPKVTSDGRQLGAVLGYRFVPRKAAHT